MTSHLVWMDLEMTGLEPDRDSIIEIATIVTDSDLNTIAEGPVFAISQSESLLCGMDEWNQTHHSASGLLQRVRDSGVDIKEAQALTLEFLAQHVEPGKAPLCGNTIWQDRRFLARHMVELEAFFHYRLIDVSSIKELARRWRPEMLQGFTKRNEHLALADIRESIAELSYYREHFFNLD